MGEQPDDVFSELDDIESRESLISEHLKGLNSTDKQTLNNFYGEGDKTADQIIADIIHSTAAASKSNEEAGQIASTLFRIVNGDENIRFDHDPDTFSAVALNFLTSPTASIDVPQDTFNLPGTQSKMKFGDRLKVVLRSNGYEVHKSEEKDPKGGSVIITTVKKR